MRHLTASIYCIMKRARNKHARDCSIRATPLILLMLSWYLSPAIVELVPGSRQIMRWSKLVISNIVSCFLQEYQSVYSYVTHLFCSTVPCLCAADSSWLACQGSGRSCHCRWSVVTKLDGQNVCSGCKRWCLWGRALLCLVTWSEVVFCGQFFQWSCQ